MESCNFRPWCVRACVLFIYLFFNGGCDLPRNGRSAMRTRGLHDFAILVHTCRVPEHSWVKSTRPGRGRALKVLNCQLEKILHRKNWPNIRIYWFTSVTPVVSFFHDLRMSTSITYIGYTDSTSRNTTVAKLLYLYACIYIYIICIYCISYGEMGNV